MKSDRADLLVVGASAAGLKCAARYRRLRPDARIVVLDASREISVGACGLPYVISGDIDDANALRATAFDVLRDEAFFANYKGIEVRTAVVADSIDPVSQIVRATDSEGGVLTFSYGDLMVATGASPIVPKAFPPLSDRVRAVKTMDDARVIRRLLEGGRVDSVGIVGAGFIGCEMAEALGAMWGCSVVLFDAAEHVLSSMLDADMAAIVERELEERSVDVRTATAVERIDDAERLIIDVKNGPPAEVDLLVVAVGVAPNTSLAVDAGLKVGPHGGILVNGQMRTTQPHIYAAGDCVECTSIVDGQPKAYALGSLANRQGRVAADAMVGRPSRFGPVAGSMIVKVFDVNAAATGMTETEAARRGMDVASVWGTFGDRAHYYPEDRRMFAKLVYERETTRVIGLQVVARGDVARLVDVFATVLLSRGKAEDLLALEFAYAPPFAAALDPLHHLGAMVMAQEQDGVRGVGPSEQLAGAICVDVRTSSEVEAAAWPTESTHVPMGEVRARLADVPDGDVVVVCEKGPRSFEVARLLGGRRRGGVRYLAGGRALRERDLKS